MVYILTKSICFTRALNSILNAKESYSVGTAGVVVTVENPDSGIKGIVQPFELGGVTRLIRSAEKFCMAGN